MAQVSKNFSTVQIDALRNLQQFKILGINYSIISHEDIISGTKVTRLNGNMGGIMEIEGLSSPFLGTSEDHHVCHTCQNDRVRCYGHLGFIDFTDFHPYLAVYNPTRIKLIEDILAIVCHACGRMFFSPDTRPNDFKQQIEPITNIQTRIGKIRETIDKSKGVYNRCMNQNCPLYDKLNVNTVSRTSKDTMEIMISGMVVTPYKVLTIFKSLNNQDIRAMGFYSIGEDTLTTPQNFIIRSVVVTPPNRRPLQITPGRIPEKHKWTLLYSELLTYLDDIRNKFSKNQDPGVDCDQCNRVQSLIGVIITNSEKTNMRGINKEKPSVASELQGRYGLIRNNMAGKRVDQSARTVIAPGPDIPFGFVGIPKKIASILTVPEIVNNDNVDRIQKLVDAGKVEYHIPKLTGGKNFLTNRYRQTMTLNVGDEVGRHLQNGDIDPFNRQPTLTSKSFMAARVILIDDDVIRLPPDYTEPFNADFDGDEMNFHSIQSAGGLEEIKKLAVEENLINTQTGSPTFTPILDTLTGMFNLFNDKKIPWSLIDQATGILVDPLFIGEGPGSWANFVRRLVKNGVREVITPEYLARKGQTVGSQDTKLFAIPDSEIGYDLLNGTDRVDGKIMISMIFPWDFYFDRDIQVSEGIVLRKPKDKIKGAWKDLVVKFWHQYSNQRTANLFTDIRRIINLYNGYNPFSVGFSDIPTEDARPQILFDKLESAIKNVPSDKEVDELIETVKPLSNNTNGQPSKPYQPEEIKKYLTQLRDTLMTLREFKEKGRIILSTRIAALGQVPKDDLGKKEYEKKISALVNGQGALVSKFYSSFIRDNNSFNLMVKSGAKGKDTNIAQIACRLGQQNYKGERIKAMMGNRCTSVNLPDDLDPRARGFVESSFLQGLDPIESFFQATAAREGISDTAVGISQTGYMNRRMIKSLEDIQSDHASAVRHTSSNIIQFMYGGHGFDTRYFTAVDQSGENSGEKVKSVIDIGDILRIINDTH